MLKSLVRNIVKARNYLVFKKYDILAKFRKSEFPVDDDNDFVVSIASYPKRDHLLPAVFEALSHQTIKPRRWILVLSVEDYPEKEKPSYINKLELKGIEIIWNINNPYAVKKLVPVIDKYPDLAVVTLDDDIIYHKLLLENLANNEYAKDGCVVGHVGKAMHRAGEVIEFLYRTTKKVDDSTPPEEVYLIGWGGIYYPPDSLHPNFSNLNKIQDIVPGRGSDIWFWAAAIATGTKQICIGFPNGFRIGVPIPLNEQTKPKDRPGGDLLEERFQKTIDYFGIRKKLLQTLPDKSEL